VLVARFQVYSVSSPPLESHRVIAYVHYDISPSHFPLTSQFAFIWRSVFRRNSIPSTWRFLWNIYSVTFSVESTNIGQAEDLIVFLPYPPIYEYVIVFCISMQASHSYSKCYDVSWPAGFQYCSVAQFERLALAALACRACRNRCTCWGLFYFHCRFLNGTQEWKTFIRH